MSDLSGSGIYQITNTLNGKFYVGSAVALKRRFYMHRLHLKRGTHRNSHLQRAWNLHGHDAFSFSVLEAVADKALLIETEQKWLDSLNATVNGYNICSVANSRLGVKISELTRQRMSDSAMGRTHTEEAKANISRGRTGLKYRERTVEHRAKIGDAHRGKVISEAQKEKLREKRKLYKHTEETRKKMSDSMKITMAAKRERLRIERTEQAAKMVAEKPVTRDLLNDTLLEAM